jgi:inner membrane protein involved in colicin E2 resistance
MTIRRLVAIAFIFMGCTTAWSVLGSSIVERTGEFDKHLSKEVALLWGGAHVQRAPTAAVPRPREMTETVVENKGGQVASRQVTKTVIDWATVPLVSTRAGVALDLEHRQKGLLWYDTYEVTFQGTYVFENPDDAAQRMRFTFAFPAEQAIYDDFTITVDGVATSRDGDLARELTTEATVPPRGRSTLVVGYRSRGMGDWRYAFVPSGVADVRDFELSMRTNFRAIDFPAGTMSPTEKVETAGGWQLAWRFTNLVTGQVIGMDLPNRINPGPLAARITFFAPVSLLFFLTVMVVLDVLDTPSRTVRATGAPSLGERLHPMNYFFISAAFFAFHLLLAYLVDHISLHAAFFVAAAVSVALVASYLRGVAGVRRRLRLAAAAQTVYLVAFSYAFFFEGLTGLAVTIGAVVTLFVLMQTTARVDWGETFMSEGDRAVRSEA